MSNICPVPERLIYARLGSDASGTLVPTGTAYNTKLAFQSIIKDTHGAIADLANSRLLVPAGYKYVRVTAVAAHAGNAVGYRACRCYQGRGAVPKLTNRANMRLLSADGVVTTNPSIDTGWLEIDGSPVGIQVGDYFTLYPAQTSGIDLLVGVDSASTWMQIEFRK